MAESIRSVGLIQNLAGLAAKPGTKAGHVEIVAGGRRLRALQLIASEGGQSPDTYMVPVIITEDRAEAEAWAGAENIVREPLHAADEIRAFNTMAKGAFGLLRRHRRRT